MIATLEPLSEPRTVVSGETSHLLGAIEAGGTKFLCGVGTGPDNLTSIEIPTTTPAETLASVAAYFKQQQVSRLGLACFGPVDINRASPTYGHITNTPKLPWRDYNIVGHLKKELARPISFDTDVNAAAVAESTWGASQGLANSVYFTIGTGIGGGAIVDGRLIHGSAHPEMGHILIRRHPADTFAGVCPSHRDCLEGLASGPALEARWNQPPTTLPNDHTAWDLEAYYLAQAAFSAALFLSPDAIVFGGGVMRQQQLITKIEIEFEALAAGYLSVLPNLSESRLQHAGLLGALLLAQQ